MRILFIYIFCFTTISCLGQKQLEKIILKHGEAIGGISNWEAVNTYIIEMESERETGVFQITSTMMRPYKFRIDFINPKNIMVKSFDGAKGWVSRNGNTVKMSKGEEVEMKEEGAFYEELAFALQKKVPLKYLGTETINGETLYKIEMIKSLTDKQTYYINSKTYLIDMVSEYSEDTDFKGTYFKTEMKKYKKFEGIYLPTYMELYANDKLFRTYKTISVKINPEVNESTFNRPNPWLNETFKKKLNEFDFWLGEWDVYDTNNKKIVGRSKIEKIVGGFGIEETFFTIPGPFHGKSLNKYNFFKRQWEQLWIDNSGMTHFFSGSFDVNTQTMKLMKEEKVRDQVLYHELTYKLRNDGTVRQIWKKTQDKKNWEINFDGIYKKISTTTRD